MIKTVQYLLCAEECPVSICWRRHLSKYKHYSKGAQVPACHDSIGHFKGRVLSMVPYPRTLVLKHCYQDLQGFDHSLFSIHPLCSHYLCSLTSSRFWSSSDFLPSFGTLFPTKTLGSISSLIDSPSKYLSACARHCVKCWGYNKVDKVPVLELAFNM